jgi:hypothetical protein
MDHDLHLKLFNSLAVRWEDALRESRLHDAASAAISAYLAFHELGDELHEHVALTWLSLVEKAKAAELKGMQDAAPEPGRMKCPFCEQSRPKSELIAGTDAVICFECLGNLSKQVRSRRSGTG